MYELILTPNAERELQRLNAKLQNKIVNKLRWLCANCDACSHKALQGRFKGKYRLKSGNYRIIYTFNKQTQQITVSQIENRSSVYK